MLHLPHVCHRLNGFFRSWNRHYPRKVNTGFADKLREIERGAATSAMHLPAPTSSKCGLQQSQEDPWPAKKLSTYGGDSVIELPLLLLNILFWQTAVGQHRTLFKRPPGSPSADGLAVPKEACSIRFLGVAHRVVVPLLLLLQRHSAATWCGAICFAPCCSGM